MDNTSPKPFVFILMPFSDDFEDVYKLGIKPACDKAGAYAESVNEQNFKETILQRIYNQIANADVIIAEMTGRNPNVFYEAGYAHALGKNVILLTQKADDIPFDLKHFPHIVYSKINSLIPKLEKKVRWFIENPKGMLPPPEPPIGFYIDGVSLLNNPMIQRLIETEDSNTIDLQIDAHNVPDKTIRTLTFQIAFKTTNRIAVTLHDPLSYSFTPWVKNPDGGLIHLPEKEFKIIPGGWKSIFIRISSIGEPFRLNEEEEIIFNLLSEIGVMNYAFKIKMISDLKENSQNNVTPATTGRRRTRRP